MPHFPRVPSTLGVPDEFKQQPRESHPPVPVKTIDSQQDEDQAKTPRGLPALKRLSLKAWTVDPKKIVESLLGKEPAVGPGGTMHPNTGAGPESFG
jgi:hypothetical protein